MFSSIQLYDTSTNVSLSPREERLSFPLFESGIVHCASMVRVNASTQPILSPPQPHLGQRGGLA